MKSQKVQNQLRQKVLLNLASSPITLIPFLIGVTILLGLWTFGINSVLAVVIGVGASMVGVGSFLTRLFVGDERVAQKSINDLQQEQEQQQIHELDKLDEELAKDRDPRTQQMLRDLRALVKTFKSADSDFTSSLDITAGVEDLFTEGVRMLRKSLEFYRTAKEVNRSTRETILGQREEILEDVAKSIDQLGKLLTGIQKGDILDHSQQERIRQELRDNFAVAKKVRERMSDLKSLKENVCLEQS